MGAAGRLEVALVPPHVADLGDAGQRRAVAAPPERQRALNGREGAREVAIRIRMRPQSSQ